MSELIDRYLASRNYLSLLYSLSNSYLVSAVLNTIKGSFLGWFGK